MLHTDYNQIVSTIAQKTQLSVDEINSKVEEKQKQLGGLVSKEGAAHVVANELKISLIEKQQSGRKKIGDIVPGMRNFEVAGKVYRCYDLHTFQRQNDDGSVREGKVASFVLADDTGFSRITLWNSQADKIRELEVGQTILIADATAKSNNGRCEVHLNDNSKLAINPEGITVNAPQPRAEGDMEEARRVKINELKEGDENVALLAHMVQLFEPRYYEICPTCSKRSRPREDQYLCPEHGPVQPAYGYLVNGTLDDGTESIRCVFFRNQVERLFSATKQDVLGMRNQPGSFSHYESKIIGMPLYIVGRVTKNSLYNRIEFVAQRVYTTPQPGKELERLGSTSTEEPVSEVTTEVESVTQSVPTVSEVTVTETEEIKKEESNGPVANPSESTSYVEVTHSNTEVVQEERPPENHSDLSLENI